MASATEAVLGSRDLVGAITAHVHGDDLLAWALAFRAARGAQAAGGRALLSRYEGCAGSVERAAWAHGLGAPIGLLQRAAASVGCVAALAWSVESAGCPIGAANQGWLLCVRAAGSGSVEAVEWLRRGQGGTARPGWDACLCTGAAMYGHLPVLQWLRSQDPPCPWDFRTLYAAQRGGHEELVAWLREAGCPAGAL